MKKNTSGFTFVELIVTSVILVILTTTGFYSYIGYLSEARDSERKSDLAKLSSSMKLYKQKRSVYPIPGDTFNITNNGLVVAYQGELNNSVSLSTLDKIPIDPFVEKYYSYSVTSNKQEYEIALSYENGDFPIAGLEGDYKTVSKDILPTIILAYSGTLNENVEINSLVGSGAANRNLFIFDHGNNLPYSFIEPYDPYYDGVGVGAVILSGAINFWQNSDYRNCGEINDAGKSIFSTGVLGTYQILNNSGSLTDTGCTF